MADREDEFTAPLIKISRDKAAYDKWAAHRCDDTFLISDQFGSIEMDREAAERLAVWLRCRLDSTSF